MTCGRAYRVAYIPVEALYYGIPSSYGMPDEGPLGDSLKEYWGKPNDSEMDQDVVHD